MTELRLILEVVSDKIADASTKLLQSDSVAVTLLCAVWFAIGALLVLSLVN